MTLCGELTDLKFFVALDGIVFEPNCGTVALEKAAENLRDLTEPGAVTLSLGPSEGAASVGVL